MGVFWGIVLYPGFYTNNNIHLLSLAVADFLEGVFSLPMYVLSYMASTREIIYGNKTDITVERTAVATVTLWLIMITLAVLPSLGWNHYDESIDDLNQRCNFYKTLPEFYVRALLIGPSVTSIFVSTVLYLQIIIIVRRQTALAVPGKMSSTARTDSIRSTKANVKLTSVLMFLFILMWLPYLLIVPFKYYSYASDKFVEIFKCVALLLTFGNSLLNALVYAFMREEYRAVYRLMVFTYPWRWRSALRELHRNKRGSVYFSRQSDVYFQERFSISVPDRLPVYPSSVTGTKQEENVASDQPAPEDATAAANELEVTTTQNSSDKSPNTLGSGVASKSYSSFKTFLSVIRSPTSPSPLIERSKASSKHTITSSVYSRLTQESHV
ncbi:hypothetical protein Btru_048314 [Bulinus truncatus]|nr:hypothetical protein Btru_048314 [Bulinus truncatus]